MQAEINPFDIVNPDTVSLVSSCKLQYLKHVVIQIIQDHPELFEYINNLLDEAIINQSNDKSSSLLEDANFPCYPDHYQLKDFNPACLSDEDLKTYNSLVSLSFVRSQKHPNVFIHGLIGQGREELAIGLGDACCKAELKTLYITYADLLSTLGIHTINAKGNDKYDLLTSANCLIIDNFAELNVYDEEMLDRLTDLLTKRELEHRENYISHIKSKKKFNPRCTIITSAFEPAEWTKYMKQDIRKTLGISRLFHSKCAVSIHVDETNIPSNKESD